MATFSTPHFIGGGGRLIILKSFRQHFGRHPITSVREYTSKAASAQRIEPPFPSRSLLGGSFLLLVVRENLAAQVEDRQRTRQCNSITDGDQDQVPSAKEADHSKADEMRIESQQRRSLEVLDPIA